MLYMFLTLLPLAESAGVPSTLATALADARMTEPEAVARALTEVVKVDPTSAEGGLADLREFDGPERQELSNILRKEGVGLADRSKLRRLAAADAQSSVTKEAAADLWRRAQQADGREEATNMQLKKQHGDHAVTAQPSAREQADGGVGLSGDSASSSFRHPLSRPT
jgi:hypothetical protein